MSTDHYSIADSAGVKTRAGYVCELCGSDEMVQAHAPGGDHSDWRNGICLCAQHHWEQHLDMPHSLFFLKTNQPYWPNIPALALAREFDRHRGTIVKAAKMLEIPSGLPLSTEDRERLKRRILRFPKRLGSSRYKGYIRQNGGGYHVALELSDLQLERLRELVREREKPAWALITDLVVECLEGAKV